MNNLDIIFNRRSIRKFVPDKPVSQEDTTDLLKAAMAAPSAGNQQPWHFIIITEKGLMEKIPEFSPYSGMCRNAPLGILVCGDTLLEKYPGYWVQDCSAAVQNILLAVTAKKLGAVWTGVYPSEDRVTGFKKLLNLPEKVIPLAFLVIGHPAETPETQNRFNESRVHVNKW
ncbi:MAG: nitroreductase family protein [Candidatus Riflebacteria bacterium]|nr:nitroreductase family protein [Candidatus Riflebacteria bacterium]